MSAFTAIHELDDGEEQDPADFEDASNIEDDSLSFGEMEEEIIAFCDPEIKSPSDIEEQNHSLNTSIGSSQELENAESARKNETTTEIFSEKPVFNIANQMQLKVDQELDSSFDSNRAFSF